MHEVRYSNAFSNDYAYLYISTYNEHISDYMAYTTIQIDVATREKLAAMRSYERETYDELLNTLMELVPSGDDEGRSRLSSAPRWFAA